MNERDVEKHHNEEPQQDFLEKRGFTWGALVAVLVLTLIAALVLGYLMATRSVPSH
jgi:hypothetical protein